MKQETDTLVCTYKGDNDVASVVWTSPAGTIDSSKVRRDCDINIIVSLPFFSELFLLYLKLFVWSTLVIVGMWRLMKLTSGRHDGVFRIG